MTVLDRRLRRLPPKLTHLTGLPDRLAPHDCCRGAALLCSGAADAIQIAQLTSDW